MQVVSQEAGPRCVDEVLRCRRRRQHYVRRVPPRSEVRLFSEEVTGRDELNERKAEMVQKAFSVMDKDGSGKITAKDIINIYDVS